MNLGTSASAIGRAPRGANTFRSREEDRDYAKLRQKATAESSGVIERVIELGPEGWRDAGPYVEPTAPDS